MASVVTLPRDFGFMMTGTKPQMFSSVPEEALTQALPVFIHAYGGAKPGLALLDQVEAFAPFRQSVLGPKLPPYAAPDGSSQVPLGPALRVLVTPHLISGCRQLFAEEGWEVVSEHRHHATFAESFASVKEFTDRLPAICLLKPGEPATELPPIPKLVIACAGLGGGLSEAYPTAQIKNTAARTSTSLWPYSCTSGFLPSRGT